VPGTGWNLHDRGFGAHFQAADDFAICGKFEQSAAALNEDKHFPLRGVLVRTDVRARLHENHQALNLVAVSGVKEQMNSLSLAFGRMASHLGDHCTIDTIELVGVGHPGSQVLIIQLVHRGIGLRAKKRIPQLQDVPADQNCSGVIPSGNSAR
jgi:hypothetical protein